jgi:hypothetical protein
MGGIAVLAKSAGHTVTGCDANVYPPMSTQLETQGIKLIEGFSSEQTKLKMSLSHKKNKTGDWLETKGHKNGRAFKVYQYSLDGVLLNEWECAQYAVKFYNMNRTSITDCLNGRQKSAKGFIWTKVKTIP